MTRRTVRRYYVTPSSPRVALCILSLALAWAFITLWLGMNLMSTDLNGTAGTNNKLQIQGHRHSTTERGNIALASAPPGTCGQVYLWGGGKSGSTTLFFTLSRGPGGGKIKDNIDNPGPIRDLRDLMIGKEPCSGQPQMRWVNATKSKTLCIQQTKNNATMQQTHIMNGCPRHTSVGHANTIMNLDGSSYTTFLMLIRDPVERLVSQLNDGGRGRQKISTNVEERAKKLATTSGYVNGLVGQLSYQGLALKALLSVVKNPQQILIIPTESMTIDMQGVIDSVMDHIGGERWKINATSNTRMNNGASHTGKYATLTNATRDALREKFREDVILLESLVGKTFAWSSWAHRSNEASEEEKNDWLATIPSPQNNIQGQMFGLNGQKKSQHRKFWQNHHDQGKKGSIHNGLGFKNGRNSKHGKRRKDKSSA